MRLVFAMTVIAAVGLAGCEREDRRMRELNHRHELAMGNVENPSVAPGADARPPGELKYSSENPYEGNAYMVSQGQQLYVNMNCVGCHANGGGGMGPPLMDDEWIYGPEPPQIYQSIIQGRPNGMPSYRGKLTIQQTWALVSYVRSMSGQLRKDVSPSRSDHMNVKVPEQSHPEEHPTRQQPGANKNEEKK
jgi:cytochrome c oxidase cbb3-type subunit III